MIPWSKFSRKIEGKLVKGNETAPPTKWWNYHWLLWFGWTKVAVFKVGNDAAAKGYHVGFKRPDCEAEVHLALCRNRRFKMTVGHEDCTFFALDEKGHEIPIELIATANKHEDWHSGAEQF